MMMLRAIFRYLLATFTIMLISICFLRLAFYRPLHFAAIEQFMNNASDCETSACFLGIILNETNQDGIYRQLEQSDYVSSYRMEIVEQGAREIYWRWNGRQPAAFRDESSITIFFSENAQLIRLNTALNLGEMILIFGEPDYVIPTIYTVFLYYVDRGFYIQIFSDCDAIWYSPISIEFRESPILPTISHLQLDEVMRDECR